MDDYDNFFVKCKYNDTFWYRFTQYMYYLIQDQQFTITLDKIICGWNIEKHEYNFANILIELASFAIYKSELIYNDTNKVTPIIVLFTLEIKKLDEIISNSTRKLRVNVDEQKLYNCKVYWNIK